MILRILFVLGGCFLVVLGFGIHHFQIAPDNKSPMVSLAENPPVDKIFGKIPLHFEQNIGQTNANVEFLARGKGYAMFLTANQAVLALQKDGKQKALRMSLAGANPAPEIRAENQLEGKTNYLTGHDPREWKTDIANFERIRYAEIYSGVDLVFYGNQQNLEYDFIVAPDVSPDKIELGFDGAENIELAENGDLIFKFGDSDLRQHKPVAYQLINGERCEIEANYAIAKITDGQGTPDRIRFQIGEYDRSQPLIIDPVLTYSTFLGGSRDENGLDIAVDVSGSTYVTGFTTSTAGFPFVNAFQTQIGVENLNAAFVTKINAAGTGFVYSTYLNGIQPPNFSGHTYGFGIAVDSLGSAYIVGITGACNFPTTGGAYIPANPPPGNGPGCSNGFAGFLTKFNPAGNGLVYSTYITSPTDFRLYGEGCCPEIRDVAVDAAGGSAYVTGYTNNPGFPTTAGAFRSAPIAGNGLDAFVMKFNPAGSGLVYSTFLGGRSSVAGDAFGLQGTLSNSIALDSANNAVVTGHTTATNFPIAGNAAQTSYAGFRDAFVTKLNSTGTGLIYSTYLGGSDRDGEPANVAVDSSGNAYVSISTSSVNFPVTPTAFRPFRDGNSGNSALAKLSANGALVYSTYIGAGNGDIGVTDVAVDAGGNAYVIGSGFANRIFPVNAGLSQGTQQNFVVKFNSTGTGLFFGSYLNGTNPSEVAIGRSIALDSNGNAYVTGNTTESTFPTTPGAPQTANSGPIGGSNFGDAFISKISLPGTDCPAITINPQPLAAPIKGQNYNQQLTATGGTAPYTFSLFPNVSQNQLPFSTTLSSTGLISGPINSIGGFTTIAAIQVTDANGCVGVRPYQMTVLLAASGRVLTPTGLGLRNAKVVLTDSTGVARVATTSSFGVYAFDGLVTGQTYTISVFSKRYRFAPRIIQFNDTLTDVDFVGLE